MASISKSSAFPSTKNPLDGLFDEFFNRSISNIVGSDSGMTMHPVNVAETSETFLIHLAAPGFDKQDMSVEVEGDQLVIRGEKKSANNQEALRYKRREFQVNTFVRKFVLPEGINADAIQAVCQNGVLEVTLPKKDEAKPVVRTIQIEG